MPIQASEPRSGGMKNFEMKQKGAGMSIKHANSDKKPPNRNIAGMFVGLIEERNYVVVEHLWLTPIQAENLAKAIMVNVTYLRKRKTKRRK